MVSNDFYSADFNRRTDSPRTPATEGEKARSTRNEGERTIKYYHLHEHRHEQTNRRYRNRDCNQLVVTRIATTAHNHIRPYIFQGQDRCDQVSRSHQGKASFPYHYLTIAARSADSIILLN